MDEKSNLKDDLVAENKQEPESLDMTPLTSFKSIMRQALGYDDLTPIDLTKHISVALRSSSGSNAIAEREADSAILRFFAGGEYPATSLKVSIIPVQEGTGDPSPENIRPITGWTDVKIYQAAEYDEEAEPVLEVALGDDAGTVYGGTLDAITGVLTVDSMAFTFVGSVAELWVKSSYSSYSRFTCTLPDESVNPTVQTADGVLFNWLKTSNIAGNYIGHIISNRRLDIYLPLDDSNFESVETLKAYLSDNNLQMIFPLATPQTYQLDPEELSTLVGENNIWADCGPVESITY